MPRINKRHRPNGHNRGPAAPRKRFLVLTEGEVTEPLYLDSFARDYRAASVDVEVAPEHGVPLTLVQAAVGMKKKESKRAKKRDDPFGGYDHVWCVFDVDEHPHLNDARQLAVGNAIELAISNPCFELWLLLHFRDNPGAQHRHRVQEMVREVVPGYEKAIAFERVEDGYQEAVKRAERLDADAIGMSEAGRNPTTGVYRLTEAIRQAATPRPERARRKVPSR